jgi:hypothetical protein
LQLLCRMSKQSQDQDKGIFCLWYALWPMTFICTAKGLEVCIYISFFFTNYFVLNWLRRLLITVNNWLNLSIINFSNLGLKLVYLLGKFFQVILNNLCSVQ